MDPSQWLGFLKSWSHETLPTFRSATFDWPSESDQRYLGNPAAPSSALSALEARLGVRLPPSYRSFLLASDGARIPSDTINRFLSVNEVQWFVEKYAEWAKAVQEEDEMDATDAEYFNYVPVRQTTLHKRSRYLRSALLVSSNEPDYEAVYLLNPEVIDERGEWEAWFFANWMPGAQRFPSFAELVAVVRRQTIEDLKEQSEDEGSVDEEADEEEDEDEEEEEDLAEMWLKDGIRTNKWSNPIPELSLLF